VFGLAVAAAINGPTWLAAGVCAAFGFAHGISHGAELTGRLETILPGMALAATLLLAAGYWLARTAGDRHALWVRICGALIGVTGLVLLRLA
jgi:hydrogenase/urease accessory protein HupE